MEIILEFLMILVIMQPLYFILLKLSGLIEVINIGKGYATFSTQ